MQSFYALNIAYRLAEDLTGPGEVLISADARRKLGEGSGFAFKEQGISISGMPLTVYAVEPAHAP